MIKSFGDDGTADLYHGRYTHHVRRYPDNVKRIAIRKLDMLNATHRLDDMRHPPGNRLEALKGSLESYYSIRINDRWRIIFQWKGDNAFKVSITDYH